MSHAIESFVVISAVIAMFGGLLALKVAPLLGRDTANIKKWVGRMSAIFLLMFLTWGTFKCYKDAYMLSRHGTPAIAHAKFKKSYVPRRRVRQVFVYELVFDGHTIEKEYHYPFESDEVRVVYDPSAPQQFMIGEANGSALKLLRTDMRGDFGFVFVWPVLAIAAATGVVFSWRRQPSTDTRAAEAVD